MFTVIKLGGCNGSGKTSIARALMKHVGGMHEIGRIGSKVAAYRTAYSNVEVVVLGSYENVCGGMDTISDKNDRLALLKRHCQPGRIIFYEGLITGKTYGAMGELSEQHVKSKRGRWLYAFMDTPFEVCVERVLQRRAARREAAQYDSGPDMFDPERTMRPTFDSCDRLAKKLRGELALRDGSYLFPHPVYMINHTQKPATAAKKLLERALEIYRGG